LEPTSKHLPRNRTSLESHAMPGSATRLPFDTELAMLALDEHGAIRDCCQVAECWFGYRRSDLLELRVSHLLPDLGRIDLTHDGLVNPRLAFLSRCAVQFDAIRRDGDRFACWLFFNKLNSPDRPPLRVLIRAVDGLAHPDQARQGKNEVPPLPPLVRATPDLPISVHRTAGNSFLS
jgi:hypothetical protein